MPIRIEILLLCLLVGAATYGFRFLPLRVDLSAIRPGGILARFLAATGPASIATLFVVSVRPVLQGALLSQAPLFSGVLAVLLGYQASKSVVTATLLGSAAYGAVFALI